MALAQVPDPWGEIRGDVRAAGGTPVAGAVVRIEVRWGAEVAFAAAAEALLRRYRLPAAKTNRDGSYVLAVLPDHRELSAIGLDWWLIVEAPGFQAWRERLPRGLHGYLGSAVTLRPADPADEVTLLAGDLDVGAGVALSRWRGEGIVVRFDAAGRARVSLPRIPCPLQPGMLASASPGWRSMTGNGARVQRPEHTLRSEDLPPETVAVTRRDGETASGARALVWNGIETCLVPVRAARAPAGTRVLGVVAEGCRLAAASPLELWPPRPTHRIRIVDEAGRRVPHARGLLLPCTEWRPPVTRQPGARLSERALWSEPRAADADGVLDLGEAPVGVPAVLLVGAAGFETRIVPDPHGLSEPTLTLTSRPAGTVQLTVLDPDGRPIEGARLCLPDAARAPATILGDDLRTDARGGIRAEGLLPGDHPLFVLRHGYVSRLVLATGVAAGGTRALNVTLAPSEPSGWIVRDDGGGRAPIPFAVVVGSLGGESDGHATDTARLWPGLCADASGRLVLPHASRPRFHTVSGESVEFPLEPGRDGFGSIFVPATLALTVVPASGLQLQWAFCHDPTGRAVNTQSGADDGIILFPTRGQYCSARLVPAGEIVLSAKELDTLPRDSLTGLRRWVVDPPRITIELPEGSSAPERWWGLRARDGGVSLVPHEVVVFRDANGAWRSMDGGAERLWFVHPHHAPVLLELTAAQRRGETPLHLQASPASRVLVDAARGGIAVTDLRIEVAQPAGTIPKFVFDAKLILGRDTVDPGTGAPRSPVELPALPAGEWVVSVDAHLVTLHNRANRRVKFTRTVRADGRTTIEIVPDDQ